MNPSVFLVTLLCSLLIFFCCSRFLLHHSGSTQLDEFIEGFSASGANGVALFAVPGAQSFDEELHADGFAFVFWALVLLREEDENVSPASLIHHFK